MYEKLFTVNMKYIMREFFNLMLLEEVSITDHINEFNSFMRLLNYVNINLMTRLMTCLLSLFLESLDDVIKTVNSSYSYP